MTETTHPETQGCASPGSADNSADMQETDNYLCDCIERTVISLEILACEYLERGMISMYRETCAIADAFLSRLQFFHKNAIRRRETSDGSPGELDLFKMPAPMALKYLAMLEHSGALHKYVATNLPGYIGAHGTVMVFKLAEDLQLLTRSVIGVDLEEQSLPCQIQGYRR